MATQTTPRLCRCGCGERIPYNPGRGRPRRYASPGCKARADAATRADRRANAEHVKRYPADADPYRGQDDASAWTLDGEDVLAEEQGEGRGLLLDAVIPDGYVRRKARPRRFDPAAAWIAEHHGTEALDGFGLDY